jgi:hypothetical protein
MNEQSKGGGGAIVVILIVVVLLGFFVLLCVGAGVAFVSMRTAGVRNMGGPVLVPRPVVREDLVVPGPAVSADAAYGPTLSPAPEIVDLPLAVVTVPVHLEADGQIRMGEDETNSADLEDRLRQERDKRGPRTHLMLEVSATPDCPATVLIEFMRVCQRTDYCSIVVAEEPAAVDGDVEE